MAELKLRMPEYLRAALAASAAKRGVSLNAEIGRRMEESFISGQETTIDRLMRQYDENIKAVDTLRKVENG